MMQDVMNEKKDVEVKVQSKDSTDALWRDLTPDKTVLGVLSEVGIMEQRTLQKKTAVALRVEGEDGKVMLVTLTAANFAEISAKIRQACLRFGEPWDF